jgi:hypothetical protein
MWCGPVPIVCACRESRKSSLFRNISVWTVSQLVDRCAVHETPKDVNEGEFNNSARWLLCTPGSFAKIYQLITFRGSSTDVCVLPDCVMIARSLNLELPSTLTSCQEDSCAAVAALHHDFVLRCDSLTGMQANWLCARACQREQASGLLALKHMLHKTFPPTKRRSGAHMRLTLRLPPSALSS